MAAGPKPDSSYTPFDGSGSTVAETDSPAGRGPRLNVEAKPNDFGAQIGGSLQQLGKGIDQAGAGVGDLEAKYQGMLNETYATNAESKYMELAGAENAKFRSLEGLAAVNALPGHIEALNKIRSDVGASLPTNGSFQSFNTLTNRPHSYAINDASLYTGQQIKKADLDSANSQIAVSIANAGSLPVAQDDKRFNDVLQDIHFGQGRQMQNQGWDSGTGMQQNTDGSHSFDESIPQGQNAKFTYDEMSNKNISAAWENRIKALSENQNVMDGYNKYKENYDKIPPEGKIKLDQYFAPKISDFQSRSISEGVLGQTNGSYQQKIYGTATNPNNIGNVKTSEGAANGTPSFVQPSTPEDGVIVAANNLRSNYQGLTIAQIGDKWAPSKENNTGDWVRNVTNATKMSADSVPNLNDPEVLKTLVHGIGVAEKKPEDLAQFTPDVLQSGITKALSGAKPNTGSVQANGATIPSLGDYYKQNYGSILENARSKAEEQRPGDIEFSEKTELRTKQQMDGIIEQTNRANQANQNIVTQAANGGFTKGTKPETIEQLVATSPQVKQAWDNMQINDPKGASAIAKGMVGTKSTGKLGDGFSYLQQQAYKGNLNVNDLLYHVGDDLTQEGFNSIKSVIKPEVSSDDRSENDQMATFLKYGHDRILHSSLFQNTPDAEQAYQNWFSSVSKQIQDKQKEGASLSTLIDPQSKDYVGKNISQFAVPVQKQLEDRATRINQSLQGAAPLSQDKLRQPGETPETYLARINSK